MSRTIMHRGLLGVFLFIALGLPQALHAAPLSRVRAFGPETIVRAAGDPDIITRTFMVNPLIQAAQVRARLTAEFQAGMRATVRFNGAEIFRRRDFKREGGVLRSDVTLDFLNTIEIEFHRKEAGALTLDIDGDIDALLIPLHLRETAGVGTFFAQSFGGGRATASFDLPTTDGLFDISITAEGDDDDRR